MTFDREKAKIHWLILTYPVKIQHFPLLSGFSHTVRWTRPTKFCQMLEDLRGLLSTVKILEKFVPQKFAHSLS